MVEKLQKDNQQFRQHYPGESLERQPIHTVYEGAQFFHEDRIQQMKIEALETFSRVAPNSESLTELLKLSITEKQKDLWTEIYSRIEKKLSREAVEDYRIDFEDGYGRRTDEEEDLHAKQVAIELGKAIKKKKTSAFFGIRIKPFNEEFVLRSIRTLDIFISSMLAEVNGQFPKGFLITLPKITLEEQSRTLSQVLRKIEESHSLPFNSFRFEIMAETPQAILDVSGSCPLRRFVEASDGRCSAVHFGTFDYTAGCGITAAHQSMVNPICDYARQTMQVALSGIPVFLSDGATNVLPVVPYQKSEFILSEREKEENRQAISRSWILSFSHIRHSLETGYYQGWDLHAAQLPVRYAAVFSFYMEALGAATARLHSFLNMTRNISMENVSDDAATHRALLNFFHRGYQCGAISKSEFEQTGLQEVY